MTAGLILQKKLNVRAICSDPSDHLEMLEFLRTLVVEQEAQHTQGDQEAQQNQGTQHFKAGIGRWFMGSCAKFKIDLQGWVLTE